MLQAASQSFWDSLYQQVPGYNYASSHGVRTYPSSASYVYQQPQNVPAPATIPPHLNPSFHGGMGAFDFDSTLDPFSSSGFENIPYDNNVAKYLETTFPNSVTIPVIQTHGQPVPASPRLPTPMSSPLSSPPSSPVIQEAVALPQKRNLGVFSTDNIIEAPRKKARPDYKSMHDPKNNT